MHVERRRWLDGSEDPLAPCLIDNTKDVVFFMHRTITIVAAFRQDSLVVTTSRIDKRCVVQLTVYY
jgi:hypothetical protein